MIGESDHYYGVALLRLIERAPKSVSIAPIQTQKGGAFQINNRCGVLIKYSSKRLSPWSFSISGDQKKTLAKIANQSSRTVLLLVCRRDGVVGLDSSDLRHLISLDSDKTQSISISRKKRGMFSASGSDGTLPHKVGRNDFVEKILSGGTRQ